jgi:hypothetical protein
MIRTRRNVRSIAFVSLSLLTGWLRAATITIPNSSFESPIAPPPAYANPLIDSWQQVPDPSLQENGSGVFSNIVPGVPGIDNCDGNQAAFLFATPGFAIFQDYDSIDWSNAAPTHAFTATYEVGKAYSLTVGVLGGTNLTFPMQEGTTLELDLYYRDAASNIVTAAGTTITNSGALFSVSNHLVDFHVQLPTVKAGDAWAGRHVGVRLLSTVSLALQGGYWDVDNVRLTSSGGAILEAGSWTDGQFTLWLQSDPGLQFEMLATTNVTVPGSNWTKLGKLTNVSGTTSFTDTGATSDRRFYRAQQVP